MRQKIITIVDKFISKLPVIFFDVTAIPISWYLAYWLRYNLQPNPSSFTSPQSFEALALLAIVQVTSFYYFKIYRGLWRFSSLNDVIRIIKSVFTAAVMVIPVFYLTAVLLHIPRSVLPLYCIILTTILCGGRLIVRMQWDKPSKQSKDSEIKKVLVIGAGLAGEGLIRDLKRFGYYHPVGIVDDNVSKRGLEIHGVRVLGTIEQLEDIVNRYQVDLIFIAIPSANSAVMRRIVQLCENTKIPFRTLPSILALVAGRVEVNALRPVNIEDLLGRDQVVLEWDKIADSISGRRVIVTGGGGLNRI